MNLEIEPLDNWNRWDEIVARWRSTTVYHRSGWLKAAAEAFGFPCVPLLGSVKGEPVLALPLFPVKMGPLTGVLSPPPRSGIEYLGLLMADSFQETASREVDRLRAVESVLRWIEERYRPSLAYLRHHPGVQDGRPFTWRGFRLETLYTYVVDLQRPAQELLATFHPSIRRDIKRCEGRLVIRDGGREICEKVHEFVSERFRSQGLQFRPTRKYLLQLYENLGDRFFQPLGAFTPDGLGAAAIVTYHGDRASFWQHAADPAAARIPYTTGLVWHAMRIAAERGCSEFEIVGANTRRLVEYKAKYRPKLLPFFVASKATVAGRTAMSLYRRVGR